MNASEQKHPKVVVIIRHAEKKILNGHEIGTGLSEDGVKHANYLANSFLLASGPVGERLRDITGKPAKDAIFDAIFAMRQDGPSHSDRPRLTVNPYAQKMISSGLLKDPHFYRFGALDTDAPDGVKKTSFKKGKEKKLVDFINNNYSGKSVLICWEHSNIREVRCRRGARARACVCVQHHLQVQIMKWWGVDGFEYSTKEGQVYGRTIVVTYDAGGKAVIGKDIWQALPDSDNAAGFHGASTSAAASPHVASPTRALGVLGARPTVLKLWPPGCVPGGGGPQGTGEYHYSKERGIVTRVAVPQLLVSIPEHPNGSAMIVTAGGGYGDIMVDEEASPAAEWLAAQGITAFVLYYRLACREGKDKPEEKWNSWPLAPLQDIQRAVRVVKSHASTYAIDCARIGVLGFSAGGHLAGLGANREPFASYTPIDSVDQYSAELAVQALIYPVITMQLETDTRTALIGKDPPDELKKQWSVETYARETSYKSSPAFLVHAEDDKRVSPEVRPEDCAERTFRYSDTRLTPWHCDPLAKKLTFCSTAF